MHSRLLLRVVTSRGVLTRASRPVSSFVVRRPHHSDVTCYSRRALSTANVEKFEFQAETKNLMDIVAKSLYSQSEVFVRELISNASDALEKRRCAELTGQMGEGVSEIRVFTDKEKRTIVFEDSGIGMNRDDLIRFLGTIAKSGSKEFIETNKENSDSVIGQFGVGFYSSFMVADAVTVRTRKIGSDADSGLCWTWSGASSYEVSQQSGLPAGTRIEIHLKSDSAEFADEAKIREVIDKYSYFVASPIVLNGERVNSLNAIWTMNPREVTKEMHENFFKHLAHQQKKDDVFHRHAYTLHYKTDTPLSLSAVIYMPSPNLSRLDVVHQTKECGLSLYARRVLIKPNAEELIPNYLRFVVGVVDSEDIPLNLSREMLQNNPLLSRIRKMLTDKILSFLASEMKKDMEKYSAWYSQYNLFLKEGVVTEQVQSLKEDVAKLFLFETSNQKAGTFTSLSEYVKRMQEGQNEIYYMFCKSRQLGETSPYMEVVKSKNREVLYLYDPADEVVFLALQQFDSKKLVSVEAWAQEEANKDTESKTNEIRDPQKKEVLDWMKKTLGSVKVHEISGNHRTSEHPFMLTVRHEIGAARHFLRTGEIKDLEHLVFFQPTLHVNFSHPLVKSVEKMRKSEPKTADMLIEQMYDNALITAGLIRDSSAMVDRLNKLLTQLAQQKGGGSTILTP